MISTGNLREAPGRISLLLLFPFPASHCSTFGLCTHLHSNAMKHGLSTYYYKEMALITQCNICLSPGHCTCNYLWMFSFFFLITNKQMMEKHVSCSPFSFNCSILTKNYPKWLCNLPITGCFVVLLYYFLQNFTNFSEGAPTFRNWEKDKTLILNTFYLGLILTHVG